MAGTARKGGGLFPAPGDPPERCRDGVRAADGAGANTTVTPWSGTTITAGGAVQLIPDRGWQRLRTGSGTKAGRHYDWAMLQITEPGLIPVTAPELLRLIRGDVVPSPPRPGPPSPPVRLAPPPSVPGPPGPPALERLRRHDNMITIYRCRN
jgi:hypothetical protein